jgi:CRISPR-associated protein Cas1
MATPPRLGGRLAAAARLFGLMPPAAAPHHAAEDDAHPPRAAPMAESVADAVAVHMLAPDGKARLEDGCLVLTTGDGAPARLRLDDVAQLCLHGHAGITTPCLTALLARGVPVVFRSITGHYAGQTIDLRGQLTAVRRAQYAAAADPARSLRIAAAIVATKIGNTRFMLRRRAATDGVLRRLDLLRGDAGRAPDLPALLGIEGAAALAWFAALPELIAADRRQVFDFPGRRRRPPTDPVNALLSYLYAILVGECATAALAAGLDPTVGFLHAERPGRPALALDLVEPLRPLVAESLALGLINRGALAAHDFVAGEGGVRLTDAGRRIVLTALERRFEQSDLRRRLAIEAQRLAQALRHDVPFVPGMVPA